ncbi:nucleotidyl transferase AbiEii/AbiGii toxin family protein [Thiotrichales bacterium 19S9-12]|nr:nucleotidyl transferase AbiEii/AbiGii toxin family protein [Thiotrichales bacterium 19S9-11]MCF6812551.1 nucleotidyl transferase AbiEii/AbiGii toxin family protein [Thiotrichales bacterium 19S9-12]
MNNFHNYSDNELRELINLTTEELGLQEPHVIEKDLFVTKAISVLMSVKHEFFELVFQGGTALAKAHKIIQRMSEDCDFRLVYKSSYQQRKKDAQRKLIRNFRKELLQALLDNGFILDNDSVKIRNEGQFISIRAKYHSLYQNQLPVHLKPYLALELFLGEVKLPMVNHMITPLIRQTFGDKVKLPEINVVCMSITETAAEKWVALTRRIATISQCEHYYDQDLVRHIYDLYMIQSKYLLDKLDFTKVVKSIVENDRLHFKKHSDLYYQNPITAIKQSLNELETNPIWSENWSLFIDTMVYGEHPSYQVAIKNLKTLSEIAINAINKKSNN